MPLCDDPWNEVVPGLWQGGHDVRSHRRFACVVTDQFDLVVSLVDRGGYGPDEGVEHHVFRIADAVVDTLVAERLQELATVVAAAVREDRRVLVRCSGGLNRSGLVVARTLVELGHPVSEAVDLVRAARGPWALTNPMFVAHLKSL
ncbi:protein-tyrosine phosphatase family protein [Nocardioides stalactiti]|uniref:protein-tyrosine phosphatase family protein n=1 Tax=Nocardioides stalactiti TaxID=2755356 RepID=UPI001601F784|nr:dual specificity protein phosphatase family protein [Nocardioides stalactiti]